MAAVDRGPGDAALWSRAARGDHDAFGQLFDRHAGPVYSYLFRLTANWSEAEDLTSAVFLQAWRRRAEVVIDRDSSLPWLLGVARRLAQNSHHGYRIGDGHRELSPKRGVRPETGCEQARAWSIMERRLPAGGRARDRLR